MRRDERGAALILTLVLVTVISLGMLALLTFSDTSIRTTVALRDQESAVSTADGAMAAAINAIRNSDYHNGAGQQCFGGADTVTFDGVAGGDAATVTCEPDPARVLIQCPSLSMCNRPGSAILTLGRTVGEDGVNISQPSGSLFRVHGVVFANSNINVVNGSLTTNTRVYARTSCTGTIVSVPSPPSCNYGATANPLGNDPNYVPAVSAAPPQRALPPCTTRGSVVTFQPGRYDDAYGLTRMMSSSSPCRDSTWWFQPGAYYFDFHNTTNPLLNPSGGHVWTVDNGWLVAGTPVNAAGAVIGAPPVPAAIPGSCNNPIKDAGAVGVQFIFGGDSQLSVKSGQAEICGTYSATRPPLAVYGLKSGTETDTVLTGLKLTSVTNTGDFGPTATPTNLSDVDGSRFASWTTPKKNANTTVTVTGHAPPSAIPAGSTLRSAAVKVTHRHTHAGSTEALTATVTPNGGAAVSSAATGRPGAPGFATTTIPIDTARTGSLAQSVYAGTFTGAKIDLRVALSEKDDIADIDAIELDLTYTAPALRAVSGCATAVPYTGLGNASRCPMVSSDGSPNNQFYVQGTTYAPTAALDITLNNAAEQVFRFGVIARTLWVKLTGSFSYGGPVIEVPDDSPGFVFSVYLTVALCPTGPCGGAPVLRAKVAFVDVDPVTPVPGARQVSVLSWSRTR